MSDVIRHRHISGPDRQGYTEIWVGERYSRIQGLLTPEVALAAVHESRRRFVFQFPGTRALERPRE